MRTKALLARIVAVTSLIGVGLTAAPASGTSGPSAPFSRQAFAPTVRPVESVLADLDGDGLADLITAVGRTEESYAATQGVSVMLGRAGGGFAPAVLHPANQVISNIAVADVNRDGRLDVIGAAGAVDGFPSSGVAFYVGVGDGTLSGPDVFNASAPFARLAAGRLTAGAAHVVRASDGGLAYARHAGGTKLTEQGLIAGGAHRDVEAVDFDGDGIAELAALRNDNRLTVYRALAPGAGLTLPGVVDLEAVDADGDGDQELAVTTGSGSVALYDESLAEVRRLGGAVQAAAATAGDWDGDGLLDLVRANATASLTVLSSRTGSATTVPLANAAVDVMLADVTRDGHADLLAVQRDASIIELVEGDGTGGFPAKRTMSNDGGAGYDRAFTDLDGNGTKDFLGTTCWGYVGDPPSRDVKSLVADGKGGFAFKAAYNAVGTLCGLSSGDFNGDGKADFVMGSYYTGSVRQVLGNGDGTFGPVEAELPGCYFGTGSLAADFNGDGYDDAALHCRNVPTSAIKIFAGSPAGLVPTATVLPYQFGAETLDLRTGDLNGDKLPDIVLASLNNNACTFASPGVHTVCQSQDPDTTQDPINYFLSMGNLLFERSHSFVTGTQSIYDVAVADVNGDGRAEILTVHPFDDSVRVRYLKPDGFPGTAVQLGTYDYPWSVTAGDIDGDGRTDIVTTHGPNMIGLLRGTGAGAFADPIGFATQAPTGRAYIDDTDRDGKLDVMVTEVGGIETFRNGR